MTLELTGLRTTILCSRSPPPEILIPLRKYELPELIASCVLRKESAPPPQLSVSNVKSLTTEVKEDPNKQLDEHASREISADE